VREAGAVNEVDRVATQVGYLDAQCGVMVEPVLDELLMAHVVALAQDAQSLGEGFPHRVLSKEYCDITFGFTARCLSLGKAGYAGGEGGGRISYGMPERESYVENTLPDHGKGEWGVGPMGSHNMPLERYTTGGQSELAREPV
jgi:hypothetical protein